MVSSELIASECLALVRTPLLAPFLDVARHHDADWAHALIARLQAACGEPAPAIWSVTLNLADAPAIYHLLMDHGHATVGDLLRQPSNRDERLACVPLFLRREDESVELPDDGFALQPADQLLFAGRSWAREQQQSLLRSDKVRDYVLTGRDPPVSWIWRQLQRPRSTRRRAARAR